MVVPPDAPTIDYRQLLEQERSQLQSELAELGPGLHYDPNFADSSQVTAERGEAEVLAGQLRESLDEVARALTGSRTGATGDARSAAQPIEPARLEAMPATRFCINHASRT